MSTTESTDLELIRDATQVTGQTVSVNGGLSFGGW